MTLEELPAAKSLLSACNKKEKPSAII